MKFQVKKIKQMSSGSSFVVNYDLDLELLPPSAGIRIEIVNTYPVDADAELVEIASESIRRGASSVLEPRGHGALLRVSKLVIHPVDFSPFSFEMYTAKGIARELDTAAAKSRESSA